MIDHIGIGVRDFGKSKSFYEAALKPLGYSVLMELEHDGERFAGLGVGMKGRHEKVMLSCR